MITKTQISGSWKLDSFVIETPEGEKSNWGENAHGLLIYDPSGFMSVSINKDPESESSNEFENLFDSILFYSGIYEIKDDIISHVVTQASNPSRIGKEMIRYYSLEKDLLTLTTPKESFGRAILVWKKI